VVRRGNTIGYVECEIMDEGGRIIAKASSSCIALRGERARGR
jgi:acyl-coenzyme A thioesterase PaaI-like protein